MQINKKIFILVETILAIMVIILVFVMIGDNRGESLGKVSVIVRNPDDNRWSAFKYGLEMAAQDCKIDLMVVSTGDMQKAEDERRVMEHEIEKGADALIVEPLPREGTNKMIEELSEEVPIMLLGHGMSEDGKGNQFPVTEPKQYEMGEVLANEIFKDYNRDMEGKTIGIISETTDSKSAEQRISGLRTFLEAEGCRIKWNVCGDFREVDDEFLGRQPEVDVIAAMDDNSLTMVGKCMSDNESPNTRVYGIGNSSEAIYYLDSDAAECLVVPDEFNVGYQSLTEVANSLRYSAYKLENQDVSYQTVRSGELFSRKNQQILFTVSQ